MDLEHQGRDGSGRLYSLSRFALFAAPSLIAAALLINAALPTAAQSQINGRVVAAPQASAVHAAEKPKLPKAPIQVAIPAPPSMRIVPGLEEPLVATGPVDAQENADLEATLKTFHDAPAKAGANGDFDDYAKTLLAFISAHPQSNWNSALQLNLGLGYKHAGYYSRAFAAFERSWQLGRNAAHPQARLMVDRAVGELARMHARVGHEKELESLFKDIGKRPIGGPATEMAQGAHEGLWAFRHTPGEAYLCGPKALSSVLMTLKAKPEQIRVAEDARSGSHGFTLTQVAALADKAGLQYTLIRRTPGQPIPVPSVVNWNVHHYAAITGMQDGKYLVADPTFDRGAGAVLTAKAIDAESSGYFLVPAKAMSAKAGWRKVKARSAEAEAAYGMGTATALFPGATTDKEPDTDCFSCPNQNFTTNTSTAAPQPDGLASPMTVAKALAMTVNLQLSDTPVGYDPQKGISARTALTYNAREAEQPATFGFSNVSPKWSFSWMAYIQDDPVNVGASVTRVVSAGGGFEHHSGYNSTAGNFPTETPDASTLFRIPPTGTLTSYEHRLPNGGKQVFTLSDGATTFPRKIFLTSVVDPQGNVTTLNYDSTLRLTSVVDAMGRSTTFTYGLSSAPLLITQVTDPFGRSSQLTYDGSGRLASITDPIGITSSFTYSASEPTFVSQLTTPYGTSKFSDTLNPNDPTATATRSLTMTDPMGFTEMLYFYQNSAITPASDPAATLPSGALTDNGLLQWRNTYYWDKHAFALGVTLSPSGVVILEDFTKARLAHWLHDSSVSNSFAGRAVGSIKQPLERRVWHNYPGQGIGYMEGTLDRPTVVGRVLDDGTTQATRAAYTGNSLISLVDAKGRSTRYTYASNNIDLTLAERNNQNPAVNCGSACWVSLYAYTYNTQHRPLTFTEATLQTWHYTWNTAGQMTTQTDPNGKVTTWNYDSLGRISNVVNPNSVTAVTYTYDSADRVATKTDSQGYTLAYTYDNLDRVISVTYPDGTTDLYDYTFQSGPNAGTPSLELRKHTDRLGRVTTWGYDADRRLISVTEPTTATTTRTTSYDYYENGTLKNITDANGNVTHWDIDIESRPISKTYGSSTSSAQTETYTYEASTSRLHSITDALGQVKTVTYDIDDRIKAITYTSTVNPTPNVTFTWDPIYERLASMTDGLGTTNFTYGAPRVLGALRLASIDGPFSNDVVGFTYDALDRLATRTLTGGNEIFGYDFLSRLTSHATPLGTFATTYLGQTNQTASRSVTNGATTVSTNWGYDTNTNDRRLISITNSGVTRSYALSYLNGSAVDPYNIAGITDTAASGHPFATQSHGYTYDSVDRLLTATSTTPGNYAYGYDNLDNATSITDPGLGSASPTYNGLNQLATFPARTYSYDNNGNTLSDGLGRSYKWDAENRLIEIDYIGTGNKTTFAYDGLGRRTVATETIGATSTATRFLWCGSRICQVRNGSDVVQSRVLPEGEYNAVSAQKAVYMQDQLGSVRDVLDGSTGALISSIDYGPYGIQTQTNGSFIPLYQYAGLMFHSQSALYLSATRAYDPVGEHWMSRDWIRELGGINLYGYVNANTSNYTDSLGFGPWDKFYGLPRQFWRWAERSGELKPLKGPNGQISKQDAENLYDQWLKDQKGCIDPGTALLYVAPIWFGPIFGPTELGCDDLTNCGRDKPINRNPLGT